MDHLTPRYVFETALWIQIYDKKTLEVDFSPQGLRIHLPTYRDFSSYFSIPKRKLGEVLSDMEKQQLISMKGPSGIWTTPKGNQFVANIIVKKYRRQAVFMLSEEMFQQLIHNLKTPKPSQTGKPRSDKKSSSDENEVFHPWDMKLMKNICCKNCQERIYTNDRRRKYCDRCRPQRKTRTRNRWKEGLIQKSNPSLL